jgi:hypothetical protein
MLIFAAQRRHPEGIQEDADALEQLRDRALRVCVTESNAIDQRFDHMPQDAQLGVEFEYQSLLSAYRHLAVPLSPAVALLFSIELGIDIAGELGGELLPQPQGGFILRLAKPQQSVRPEEARRMPRRRWPLRPMSPPSPLQVLPRIAF